MIRRGTSTFSAHSFSTSFFGAAIIVAFVVALLPSTGSAAAPITVAQGISQQGSTQTVRGYIVGQPTATTTVVRSNFPSDYAVAIADSASETDTSRMLYVQLTTSHRGQWGLQSNPSKLGQQVDVTGPLQAYFSHAGLKSPTTMVAAGGGTDPGPDPDPDPADYYAGTSGLTGEALKNKLNDIISDQTKLSYSQVWDALKVTDEDPSNSANVRLFYSGLSRSKSANGGSTGDWNREHVWPQSHGDFGTSTGPGTDLHHLRPTDVQVNSIRGNKDFDLGGSSVSGCSACKTDGDSFEPPADVKGDVARMVMYMAVRYEGEDGFADLETNDSVNGQTPNLGRISVLLQWHQADPPTAAEQSRNEKIYSQFQGNRNPFIDHPEWAAAIFG